MATGAARGIVSSSRVLAPAAHVLAIPRRGISGFVEPVLIMAQDPAAAANALALSSQARTYLSVAEPAVMNFVLSPQMLQILTVAPPVLLQFVFISPLPTVKAFRHGHDR